MKRLIVLVLLSVGSLILPPQHSAQGQEKSVLLVVKDGPSADLELMLTREVGVMRSMLESAGFTVVVASPSGRPLEAAGKTVNPDLRLADARMADYEGIILPCMALEQEPSSPEVEALVREAVFSGKPVAAQTGSVVTLARSGVLKGRKYAYVKEWAADVPEFEGLKYGGEGVVRSENVITSGVCPYAAREQGLEDGTQALTGAFIAMLWDGRPDR